MNQDESHFEYADGQAYNGQVMTCIQCQLYFTTSKAQRVHYQSDLHKFNLKRKMVGLAPLSQEQFKEQLAKAKQLKAQQKQTMQQTSGSQYCKPCRKKFGNINTYNTHINSKRHKERLEQYESELQKEEESQAMEEETKVESPVDAPETPVPEGDATAKPDSGDTKPQEDGEHPAELTEADIEAIIAKRVKNAHKFALEECLFCMKKSETFQDNITHMGYQHGLYIPDADYVVDLEGLFTYLSEKLAIGYECFWCNGKGRSFHSMEAAQKHMRDKGHCKLLYDGNEQEYSDYYDFSKDYQHLFTKSAMRKKLLHSGKEEVEGGKESTKADGEEKTKGEDEDEEEEDIIELLKQSNMIFHLSDDGLELVLANGKVIGHRSLRRYYKQHFRPETRENVLIGNLIAQQRVKLLSYTKSWELQQRKNGMKQSHYFEKAANQHKLKLGIRNNKHQRMNFRDQNSIYLVY